MGRTGGSLSLSLAVLAAAQLLYNPPGHAQGPPPPQPQPQVQDQDEPGQPPTVAPQPPYPYGQPYAPYGQPYAPYGQPYPPPIYGPIVTLRADNPRARLQVMTQLNWQDVCLAPCNVPVHPGGTYRVGGGSIRGSEPFTMPRPSGPVLIDVQVGSKVKRGIGIGLTVGGIASAVLGGVLVLSELDGSNNNEFSGSGQNDQAVGIVYLVIGAVLLAIGIPLSASNTLVQIR